MEGLPAGMVARSGSRNDSDAVLRLLQQWDLAETGEIDTDLTDVLFRLPSDADDLSRAAMLIWSGEQLLAAAFLCAGEGEVYVAPEDQHAATLERLLLHWLISEAIRTGQQLRMTAAADATVRQARYAGAGLSYAHSIMQYQRSLACVPQPDWPAGVHVQKWAPERDARDVFRLIREAFREIPGQPDREWSWWSARVLDRNEADVLTVREGESLIGAVVMNSYDTYGHVPELAVRKTSRGRGLGRALLLAAFQQFAARGLDEIRLGVYAANRTASSLYTSVGMTLLSEWQVWTLTDSSAEES